MQWLSILYFLCVWRRYTSVCTCMSECPSDTCIRSVFVCRKVNCLKSLNWKIDVSKNSAIFCHGEHFEKECTISRRVKWVYFKDLTTELACIKIACSLQKDDSKTSHQTNNGQEKIMLLWRKISKWHSIIGANARDVITMYRENNISWLARTSSIQNGWRHFCVVHPHFHITLVTYLWYTY